MRRYCVGCATIMKVCEEVFGSISCEGSKCIYKIFEEAKTRPRDER